MNHCPPCNSRCNQSRNCTSPNSYSMNFDHLGNPVTYVPAFLVADLVMIVLFVVFVVLMTFGVFQ